MSFEKIASGQTIDDALKGNMLAMSGDPILAPEAVFDAERIAWADYYMASSDRQMYQHFGAIMRDARVHRSGALMHILSGDKKGAHGYAKRSLTIIAMTRLMRLVLPDWQRQQPSDESEPPTQISVAGAEYDATNKGKRLLDMHDGTFVDEAFGLTVHRDLLAMPPFGCDRLPKEGRQWFVNRQEGLYVAAQTPAVVSQVLREQLALSVGGLDNAEALIDAQHSVTLLPYLSYRHLNNQPV